MTADQPVSKNSKAQWQGAGCRLGVGRLSKEIAKQSFIQNMAEDSVFIVMDWAMKFLQKRFREKECDWYAKRGMNWHVSCAIASDGKGNFFVSFYNHLFNSCSQDWFSVLSILESLLITVRSSNPKVKKLT